MSVYTFVCLSWGPPSPIFVHTLTGYSLGARELAALEGEDIQREPVQVVERLRVVF